jgi:O-antigen/teichoic acid export membrane protein
VNLSFAQSLECKLSIPPATVVAVPRALRRFRLTSLLLGNKSSLRSGLMAIGAPLSIMGKQFHSLDSQISKLLTWILYSKQASLAISDQAVISAGSLFLTVVIARTSGIELLGSVAFILILAVVGGIPLGSLVSAPAMVLFGSMGKDAERYRGFLLLTAALIGLLMAIVLSAVYVIYRQRTGVAISTDEACIVAFLFCIIPVQEALRRAAFARSRPWAGVRLSVTRHLPPPIALLWASQTAHPFGLFEIVLVLAVTNLASVMIDLVTDLPRIPGYRFSAHMLRRHWQVSRWLLLSSVFNSAYEQIFTLASGIAFGNQAIAAIRICQQVFGIILAGMQTFENTVPQQLVLAAGGGGQSYRSLVNLLAALVFFSVVVCGPLLWWFGDDLIWIVFHIDYQQYASLLLFWALAIACNGARTVYAMAFRAIQDTKPIFVADGLAFLAGATIVIPILHWFGVIGSGIGMLITNLVGLITLTLQDVTRPAHERT